MDACTQVGGGIFLLMTVDLTPKKN